MVGLRCLGRACPGITQRSEQTSSSRHHPVRLFRSPERGYLMPMCSGSVGDGGGGAAVGWGVVDATVLVDTGLGGAPGGLPAPGFAVATAVEGAADSAAVGAGRGASMAGAGSDTVGGGG